MNITCLFRTWPYSCIWLRNKTKPNKVREEYAYLSSFNNSRKVLIAAKYMFKKVFFIISQPVIYIYIYIYIYTHPSVAFSLS